MQLPREQPKPRSVRLLVIGEVAELLRVSPRHVSRLSAAGVMPQPLRLGTAIRWDRVVIEDWIARGCPGSDSATGERLQSRWAASCEMPRPRT
jgi:predicted DNA-binding transcriptional regulator AlpA